MIKSILVPTDFSECAGFALDAAVQLAARFDARIHLMHCLPPPSGPLPADEALATANPPMYQVVQEALQQLEALTDRYPDSRIDESYSQGKLTTEIDKYVRRNGIDLILMGSYGASGKSEFFIGSNTQKVVRTVHCPVLVIKRPVPQLNFDKVVFASSFNENEKTPFLHFKNLVKHFIPEIHLVIVHTSSLFDPPYIVSKEAMEDFKTLCSPFDCHTHILRDYSIERAVRSFAEEIGAGLIGISNHYRHPFKRMLVGSNVEALVNHSTLPVLSIDFAREEEGEKI